ncbi:hypothetical protein Tco_0857109 [Tanacetum coccineum]|uniref:Uncharacterized protein n=1 Tax=Tanacetum coccineum TaxID=301880 RepID=A0ABQ5B7E3_9ASTR
MLLTAKGLQVTLLMLFAKGFGNLSQVTLLRPFVFECQTPGGCRKAAENGECGLHWSQEIMFKDNSEHWMLEQAKIMEGIKAFAAGMIMSEDDRLGTSNNAITYGYQSESRFEEESRDDEDDVHDNSSLDVRYKVKKSGEKASTCHAKVSATYELLFRIYDGGKVNIVDLVDFDEVSVKEMDSFMVQMGFAQATDCKGAHIGIIGNSSVTHDDLILKNNLDVIDNNEFENDCDSEGDVDYVRKKKLKEYMKRLWAKEDVQVNPNIHVRVVQDQLAKPFPSSSFKPDQLFPSSFKPDQPFSHVLLLSNQPPPQEEVEKMTRLPYSLSS